MFSTTVWPHVLLSPRLFAKGSTGVSTGSAATPVAPARQPAVSTDTITPAVGHRESP